jgi:hypothetical protein
MSAIRELPTAFVSGTQGIQRGVERFERAAAEIATAGPTQNGAAVLHISDEARAAAQRVPSLEEAVLESQVATHEFAANVRSLQASDEMASQLLDVINKR